MDDDRYTSLLNACLELESSRNNAVAHVMRAIMQRADSQRCDILSKVSRQKLTPLQDRTSMLQDASHAQAPVWKKYDSMIKRSVLPNLVT